jgi:hypothetical protein
VAVINAAMARFYFGGSDPVGRLVHVDSTSYQVVGVVADVTDHDLRAPPARRLYFAMAQSAATAGVSFAVRTTGDPARAVAAVRRELLAADPSLRVSETPPHPGSRFTTGTEASWMAHGLHVRGMSPRDSEVDRGPPAHASALAPRPLTITKNIQIQQKP